jgi:hypothetical protein
MHRSGPLSEKIKSLLVSRVVLSLALLLAGAYAQVHAQEAHLHRAMRPKKRKQTPQACLKK